MKASDNAYPSMLYLEGTTPSSPAASHQRLFVRSSDHVLCMVNSSGTVTALSGALANPMTTKGDIIQADTGGTPVRLAAGTSGYVLTAGGAGAFSAWAAPAGGTLSGAKAYASAGQSLNDVVIPFNSEEFDTDGYHEAVTNPARVTVPTGKGGKFLLLAGSFANGATRLLLRLNGTTQIRATGQTLAASGYTNAMAVTTLADADYVEVLPQAGTTRTYGDNSEVGAQSSLTIVKIG